MYGNDKGCAPQLKVFTQVKMVISLLWLERYSRI